MCSHCSDIEYNSLFTIHSIMYKQWSLNEHLIPILMPCICIMCTKHNTLIAHFHHDHSISLSVIKYIPHKLMTQSVIQLTMIISLYKYTKIEGRKLPEANLWNKIISNKGNYYEKLGTQWSHLVLTDVTSQVLINEVSFCSFQANLVYQLVHEKMHWMYWQLLLSVYHCSNIYTDKRMSLKWDTAAAILVLYDKIGNF